MKKILLILITVLVVLFAGCSANYEPEPEEEYISIYDSITYSTKTLTFSNTSRNDILHGLENIVDEFFIAYEDTRLPALSEDEITAYTSLLEVIEDLSDESRISYGTIIDYELQEFTDECYRVGIDFSLTDIIMFTRFVELLDQIKEENGTSYIVISKIEYMEGKLDRALTQDEKNSLETLQSLVNQVTEYGNTIPFTISTKSSEELQEFFTNEGVFVSEDALIDIDNALEILNQLKKDPTTE